MTRRRLLVATRSVHKLRELRELLDLRRTDLVSLDDLGVPGDPDETGETFETNAAIKARFGARATGCRPWPTTPASRSTRSTAVPACGPAATPASTQPTRRTTPGCSRPCAASRPARRLGYVCVLALALPELGRAHGLASGSSRPADVPRADRHRATGNGGFGYDPIFEPASEPPGGRTLGLWTPAEKHAISHRARAARRLAPRLRELGF